MVTLNDPITSQNIVDRFEELATDIADSNIRYGEQIIYQDIRIFKIRL